MTSPRLARGACLAAGVLLVVPAAAAAQAAQSPDAPDSARSLVAWEVPDAHPAALRALEDLEHRLDDDHPGDPIDVVDLPGPTTVIGIDSRLVPPLVAESAPMRISGTGIRILSHLDGTGPGLDDHDVDPELVMRRIHSERIGNLDDGLAQRIEASRRSRAEWERVAQSLGDPNLTGEERARLKAELDALTTTNQIDMLRLQSMMSKRNESLETINQLMRRIQDGVGQIIRNMR